MHPRTAAGLSADNRYLFLLVLDGRQPQHSRGADLHETAQRLAELGAHEGVNLDGGGSTTLVIQSLDGSQKVVNRPPSPLLRVNGNHLGVKAEPLPSA